MNCNTTHYRANSSSVPGDPTGPRADTHALAHVAFNLLTGFPYWEEESREGPWALLMRLLKGFVEPPTARAARRGAVLPAGFDEWFGIAAAVSPAARYASPREAIDALAALYGISTDGSLSGPQMAAARAITVVPHASMDYAGLASAATMVGGTPPSALSPSEPRPAAPQPLGSSPQAYSGVMAMPLAPTFVGPPGSGTGTLAPQGYATETVIGPPPSGALADGSTPTPFAQAPVASSSGVIAAPAKPARKHSAASMIAAGACAALLAIGFVVIIVLGAQRGKTKRATSSSSPTDTSTGVSSTERLPPCRSGNMACKEIRQSLGALDGSKLLEHAEMLAREIDPDAKLYQIDLQSAVYQGKVDGKEGRVSIMFGANGKAIVVTIQNSELIANSTPNVSLPGTGLERPRCSVANAWQTAIEMGANGSSRLSMFLHADRRGKAWQVMDDRGEPMYVSTATCDPM